MNKQWWYGISVQMENHLAKKKRATEATNADKYQKHYVK